MTFGPSISILLRRATSASPIACCPSPRELGGSQTCTHQAHHVHCELSHTPFLHLSARTAPPCACVRALAYPDPNPDPTLSCTTQVPRAIPLGTAATTSDESCGSAGGRARERRISSPSDTLTNGRVSQAAQPCDARARVCASSRPSRAFSPRLTTGMSWRSRYGGTSNRGVLSDVHVLDLEALSWSQLRVDSPLSANPGARHSMSLVPSTTAPHKL